MTFARGARPAGGGFDRLDDVGVASSDHTVHTWITTRMTHVTVLGTHDPATLLHPNLLTQVPAEASLASALTCARPGAGPPTVTDVAVHRP
ncbi:hypothetical protein ACWGR4_04540 [Embleya sp. NPDC055664]